MDALPMTEQNTFAHRSTHAGRMHGCGHDGHTAMLLAAAEYLAKTRCFDGTVNFIFQPAEEGRGGAAAMIADGLFERFPMQAVFGLHNWPGLPVGEMAVHDGPAMASSDEIEIVIEGRGAHAAMPHLGADPVLAGAAMVQALQSIVSRNLSPVDCGVVSITQFHAGRGLQRDPAVGHPARHGTGLFGRGARPARSGHPPHRARCGAAHGVTSAVSYRRGYPPTVNTGRSHVLRHGRARTDGRRRLCTLNYPPSMGAEDFAYMLQEKPGCYIWLGNGGGPDVAPRPGHEEGAAACCTTRATTSTTASSRSALPTGPSGDSMENPAPRPGTASMIRWVCCQYSNWDSLIQNGMPPISPSCTSELPSVNSPCG
jgi:metal-dependent amidase/aminoacylase/carboxypeptidase family protein